MNRVFFLLCGHGKPGAVENPEHRLVRRKHLGLEARDTLFSADQHEVFEKDRCKAFALKVFLDDEGDFCARWWIRLSCSYVAPDTDYLLHTALADARNEGDVSEEVHISGPFKLLLGDLLLRREEAGVNRALLQLLECRSQKPLSSGRIALTVTSVPSRRRSVTR